MSKLGSHLEKEIEEEATEASQAVEDFKKKAVQLSRRTARRIGLEHVQ